MSVPITRKQVTRARKLAALARSPNEHEAQRAAEKAAEQIRTMDLDYLETLDEQRDELLKDLRAENERLISSKQRATKAVTGALVTRATLLLNHYRNADALPAAIELLNVLNGSEPTRGDS